MGQDPVAIREAIEETRSRMGDTVAAIGYRTDVKSRARENVAEMTGRARESFDTLGQRALTRLRERRVQIALAASVVLVTAGTAGGVLTGRYVAERRRERLAVPARRLPTALRQVALPAARNADRWLAGTARSLQDGIQARRDRVVSGVSDEIARALADEQERRNPFWRNAARNAASAAATTAATMAVRRAMGGGPSSKAA